MEILAEILFTLLGWVAELVLQLLFELLAGAGLRALREPFRPRREASPHFAAIGYLIFGAVAGAISLWPFPQAFLAGRTARLANLVLSPLVAGGVMASIGNWRRRRGDPPIRLDRFAYGLLFAAAMATVRFLFAAPA